MDPNSARPSELGSIFSPTDMSDTMKMQENTKADLFPSMFRLRRIWSCPKLHYRVELGAWMQPGLSTYALVPHMDPQDLHNKYKQSFFMFTMALFFSLLILFILYLSVLTILHLAWMGRRHDTCESTNLDVLDTLFSPSPSKENVPCLLPHPSFAFSSYLFVGGFLLLNYCFPVQFRYSLPLSEISLRSSANDSWRHANIGADYQVFLSFRGPDTCQGFTECL